MQAPTLHVTGGLAMQRPVARLHDGLSCKAMRGCPQQLLRRSAIPPAQLSAPLFGSGSAPKKFVRRSLRVCAAWGDPIEWQPAKVLNSEIAAEGMQRLALDIGKVAEGYMVPGQYIQMRIGKGKPGFFAIASPPDPNNAGVVELLVKSIPDTSSEKIARCKAGDAVEVSPVMGNGFKVGQLPVDKFDTVLMFATGSGIAPIKALIESEDLQIKQRSVVKLYYGTRTEAMTPFRKDAVSWASDGLQLINVYSSEGNGYIQDIFAKEVKQADGTKTGAVLCGQKEMAEQMTKTLLAQGVAKESILMNF